MTYRMGNEAVTYFPTTQAFYQGSHEVLPQNSYGNGALIASLRKTIKDKKLSLKTTMLDKKYKQLSAVIRQNRGNILSGALTAADFTSNRANLDSLILIRLFNQLMGEQKQWFHLDNMFNGMDVDKLLLRIPFKDNPAAAQLVPRREEYDTTLVKYDEIQLDLPKIVTSHDLPIEDPLRSLIDPLLPLQQSDAYAMNFFRENEALAALQKLGNHYTKNATKKARFTAATAPNDTATARVSNPDTLAPGNVHSDHKMVNEIQNARTGFLEEYDVSLTHFAMSPKTAMAIAQNTWTENNTIFNVEAYRTEGGVRAFPGLADATAVISIVVPDNVIYAGSKPNNIFIKAEGPKITKSWDDPNHWTQQTALADFHQYKCAHEDLSKITRKFGLIIDLQTT